MLDSPCTLMVMVHLPLACNEAADTCLLMRQARQRAELNATDAEDKLKAYVWAADPRNGEGAPGEGGHAKAMADLDASLMQRLDEDSATNHRLLDSLTAAQVWPAN